MTITKLVIYTIAVGAALDAYLERPTTFQMWFATLDDKQKEIASRAIQDGFHRATPTDQCAHDVMSQI